LANMESLNAHFINEGISQKERLQKLNKIAIEQMKILSREDIKPYRAMNSGRLK